MAIPGENMIEMPRRKKSSLPYYWTIDEGMTNLRERLKRSEDPLPLRKDLEGGRLLKKLLKTVPLAQRKQIVAFINSM